MRKSVGSVLTFFVKFADTKVKVSPVFYVAVLLGLLVLQAGALGFLGQPVLSQTHRLMVWAGGVLSPENSQQLLDWYTPSHVIHGFLFYFGLWFFFPWLTIWHRLVLATGIEVAWEVAENTPTVINHYREQALAQGYFGDSIINSLSDTAAMIIGFLLAWRLPMLVTVTLGIFLEFWVGYSIHDNLFLNILGFVWTPEFIAQWQRN